MMSNSTFSEDELNMYFKGANNLFYIDKLKCIAFNTKEDTKPIYSPFLHVVIVIKCILFLLCRWGTSRYRVPCPTSMEAERHMCLQSCLKTYPPTPQKSNTRFAYSQDMSRLAAHTLCFD